MGYRAERKHKQEQRAYANWQCQKDREQDAYFDGEPPPLTDDEREHADSDEYWHRLEAEARLIGVGEWK